MLYEDTKILEFNQYEKSNKVPFIGYTDLECIIEKIDGCKNNPENSSTISSFRSIENKADVYRGKDCMKKFCESLREHAIKIINFKKKKMKFGIIQGNIEVLCKAYVIKNIVCLKKFL